MKERNRARKLLSFGFLVCCQRILNLQNKIHRKVQAFQSKLWEDDLRSLGPEDGSLWEMSEGLRKKKSPVYALNGRAGIAHTDSDKAEVLACSLESQFQDNNISNDTDYLTNRVVENYFLNENNFDTPLPPPMPSRKFLISLRTLNTGHFPDHWKTASIIPILKPDDTAILAQSASKACVTHFLHKHLVELEDWYKKWKIAINPTKTEAVFFSNGTSARPPAPVHVQNHPVPWSKTVKYLGVILDQHLSFNPHIVNAKKTFRALACIYSPYFTRNSPLSLKNRMLIYTSIIRSVLLYACPVWGHAARGNNILEQSQNVIIRQITNSPWFVRNADLRFALRLKTIKATIKKIAEKFFNNLDTIDNRTLRKIERYTPDPKFNRPRNILLPDHTPNRVTASPLDRN
ncbi:probable RNA-directed DNA polymerase from transposon X-element [Trichonephila clavipes]|nr:probable RNA-directed DNA polymerase from transposon X-element [Trichonephila clavipes]